MDANSSRRREGPSEGRQTLKPRVVLQPTGWMVGSSGRAGGCRTFAHVVQHQLSFVPCAKALEVPRPKRGDCGTVEGRCWLTRREGAHLQCG